MEDHGRSIVKVVQELLGGRRGVVLLRSIVRRGRVRACLSGARLSGGRSVLTRERRGVSRRRVVGRRNTGFRVHQFFVGRRVGDGFFGDTHRLLGLNALGATRDITCYVVGYRWVFVGGQRRSWRDVGPRDNRCNKGGGAALTRVRCRRICDWLLRLGRAVMSLMPNATTYEA